MPILNTLDEKKTLSLVNYIINEANAIALANSFDLVVPDLLVKLILISNSLSDKSIAYFVTQLEKNQNGCL